MLLALMHASRSADLSQLDLSQRTYKAVSSSSVAHWLKSLLEEGGVNTSIFTAHSTRGASSSAATNVGVITNEILKVADWSSESVSQRFYYRLSDNPSHRKAVLSSNLALLIWETEPSVIIHKWLRP